MMHFFRGRLSWVNVFVLGVGRAGFGEGVGAVSSEDVGLCWLYSLGVWGADVGRCPIILSVTNSSYSNKTNVRTSVGAVSTLKKCTTSTVATMAMRGAMKMHTMRIIPTRVIYKRVRTMVRSLRPSTIGVKVMDRRRAMETVTSYLHGFHPRRIMCSPIVISADKQGLVGSTTVRVVGGRLFPLAALLAPGLSRMRILANGGVIMLRSVRRITERLSTVCQATMLVGKKR